MLVHSKHPNYAEGFFFLRYVIYLFFKFLLLLFFTLQYIYFLIWHSPFVYSCFFDLFFECYIYKTITKTNANKFPLFSSSIFAVSGPHLSFNSLLVDFYGWCMVREQFHSLHMDIQFSQHHILQRVFFPHFVF